MSATLLLTIPFRRFRPLIRAVAVFVALSLCPVYATTQAPVRPASPALPKIPPTRLVLTDFGGVSDGIALNTDAFARALDALSAKGGGTLVVPPGLWHTGPIELRSRICLHL